MYLLGMSKFVGLNMELECDVYDMIYLQSIYWEVSWDIYVTFITKMKFLIQGQQCTRV